MSRRNVIILKAIATIIAQYGLPFIIAADWQCTPGALEATQWHTKLGPRGAHIRATDEPTCSTDNTIDFYVCDNRLRARIDGPYTDMTWPARAHRPIRLVIRAKGREDPIPMLQQPHAFPREVTIGP